MIYVHTNFYMPISKGSIFITIKIKKYRFCMAAMALFHKKKKET